MRSLIHEIQTTLETTLSAAFEPYREDQVHGTIIGLEGIRRNGNVLNQNYLEQCCFRSIHFPRLFEILKVSRCLPFTVQMGGFDREKNYSFTSRGQHPYLRSFSIQGVIAVAMGWPTSRGHNSLVLDELRRSLNSANVLHKYHPSPADIDNDFFLVLGHINRGGLSAPVVQEVQEQMRAYLECQPPCFIPIV